MCYFLFALLWAHVNVFIIAVDDAAPFRCRLLRTVSTDGRLAAVGVSEVQIFNRIMRRRHSPPFRGTIAVDGDVPTDGDVPIDV
jgi:hypothetical protein